MTVFSQMIIGKQLTLYIEDNIEEKRRVYCGVPRVLFFIQS